MEDDLNYVKELMKFIFVECAIGITPLILFMWFDPSRNEQVRASVLGSQGRGEEGPTITFLRFGQS